MVAESPDTEHRFCCNEDKHEIPRDCFFIDAPGHPQSEHLTNEILEGYRAKGVGDPKHFDPVVLKSAQNLISHLLTHPEPNYTIGLTGHTLTIDVEIPLDTETMQKIRSCLPSTHWD